MPVDGLLACSAKAVGKATPLLAQLYAEQLVALAADGVGSLEALPTTIPDLMLGYVSNLNRHRNHSDPDNPTVHRAAQIAAWHCLKETFRPGRGQKAEIRQAFEKVGLQSGLLDDLEHRLGFIRTIAPAETDITFSLDPLSENLAALHFVETSGYNEQLWTMFFTDADRKPGGPPAIRGFLSAVRDCCMTKIHASPPFVFDELTRRIGDESIRERDNSGGASDDVGYGLGYTHITRRYDPLTFPKGTGDDD